MIARTEPLRYLGVAAFCAALNNLVLIGGAALGLHYAVGLALSFVVVVAAGYLAHTAFTFRRPATLSAFGRYAGAMLAALPLSFVCLFVFCDLAKLPMWIAAPATTVVTVIANYALSRWAVLPRASAPEPDLEPGPRP